MIYDITSQATPPGNFEYIPPTNLVSAPAGGLYADIFFGVMGVIFLVWLITIVVRNRDWTPILLVLGGALVVAYEPIVDVLGKIVYPLNYTYQFVSFGRTLPLWLFVPYAGFLGIFPYLVAQFMRKKDAKKKHLYLMAVAMFVAIFVLDFVVSHTGHYAYYGTGLGRTLCGSLEMAAFPIISGYLYLIISSYKGILAKLASFFVPSIGFAAAFASTVFPLSFALNTSLPLGLDIFFRVCAVLQTVLVVAIVSSLAIKHVEREKNCMMNDAEIINNA